MKKLIVIVSLCGVTGVLLCGCSKSKTAASQSGTSADSKADSGSSTIASDAPAEMKVKWEVGKKYAMRMELNQDTETTLPNRPQPVKQELKLMQDFTLSPLKDLDNGGKQLELKFDDETLNVTQDGRQAVNFDSTQNSMDDASNPAALVLRAISDTKLEYFVDADARVEKIEGMDELKNRIATTASPQQQAMFMQMFDEETLRQYASFGDAMPNRAVNVGESWSVRKDVVVSIGVVTVNIKFTFKNWERHNDHMCAHIESAGDISTKSISATAVGAAVEIKNGKISGEFWFDPQLGMIVDTHTDESLPLKITTRQQILAEQLDRKIRMSLVDVTP